MSTETQYYFAVWAPDYTDADALTRRLAQWPHHLAGMQAHVASGALVTGGAFVDEASLPASVAEKKMDGSLMVFKAASVAEVRKIVEADTYWVNNVWDKEKLDIRPWIPAKPL
ncbi:hypothetical protein DENSPDRAFT_885785 [Dentipellis sp. KUC8613]|nr:hypothetical protein DENSPDRAFT_885785 [Dentipellis sp. KUC8613]